MIPFIAALYLFIVLAPTEVPEVKVAGAMKNIMMQGDLSAHMNLDTVDKSHLYGLGPVAGLKGELLVWDGKIYSTTKDRKQLLQQDKVSQAAMLVYSNVEKWKSVSVKASINSYAELEKLIETTAKSNGYDTEIPFAFKIEAVPVKASYHIIDWVAGATHTMDNHKQFAYAGTFTHTKLFLLGFYSTHHQSIFTHHTTYMHIHALDEKTKTTGHLDDIQINGFITISFPEI